MMNPIKTITTNQPSSLTQSICPLRWAALSFGGKLPRTCRALLRRGDGRAHPQILRMRAWPPHVSFPVTVNLLRAVRNVDPDLVNLAQAFKAARTFWKAEFPNSVLPMFAGLRIGSTLPWSVSRLRELAGGNAGQGYLLSFGGGLASTRTVFVSILTLTLVGSVAYVAV